MEKRLDGLFALWSKHPGAGGQILVTHKGKTIFEKCYGYANMETGTPMSPDSVFHVASVTKQFTAMAVLILHERGLLNVYDDVRKYIPDLVRFSQPLTLKQLMNHLSGLREYYDLFYLGGRSMEDHLAQREARELIARQDKLNFEPGTEFLYTNANYMFLATIIERVSGMSYGAFLKESIFDPLGMDTSFIRDDPRMIVPNKVSSYHDDGHAYTNAILTFGLYGATGLHTTCRQLHKFLQQYMNPTLISRKTMEEIMFDIPEIGGKKGNYAGGVRINELEGHRFIHHGGVNAGYRTVGAVYPEDELIIIAFTNTYNIPIETAARNIARIVLDLPMPAKKNLDAYKTHTVNLEGITGMYYSDQRKDYAYIRESDGKIYMDGSLMDPMGGNLFKQGRMDTELAVGEEMVIRQGASIVKMRKLEDTIDAELGLACAGTYICDDAQARFRVAYRDGCLYLQHWRHPEEKLYRLSGEEFFYKNRRIRFCRDAEGQVTGYLFNSGHLRDVEFTKVN